MFTNLAVIIFLPLISQDSANDGAGVLDHHLPGLDVSFTEKASTMNLRSEDYTTVEYRLIQLSIQIILILIKPRFVDITCKLLLLLWRFFPGA